MAEMIYLIIIGGIIAGCGVFQLCSGIMLTMSRTDFTKDSKRKFARVCGVIYIIFGILIAGLSLGINGKSPLILGIIIGCAAVLGICFIVLRESILVKEEIH